MSADRADGELRLFTLPGEVPSAAAAPIRPPATRGRRGGRGRRRPSPLLLVVDGTGLAHRVFHAVGGVDAPEVAPVERFIGVLCRLAGDAKATACVVGFDDPARSLRRDAEPAYKAQRPPKPAELIDFLDRIPALLTELGFAVITPAGLEADDVLGSAADLAERHRVAATLATGDRDAFALVRPTVSVWFLGNGGSVEQVSPSWLAARYGVKPAAYLDFAALRGDTSDNLPGVRGIGAMTAARLLAVYPTVEAALADRQGLARLLGPALTHTLVDGRTVFMHNRELMRVRTDIPIDLDACNQALDRRAIMTVLRDVGLAELTDRVLRSFSLLGSAAWRCPPPARNGSAGASTLGERGAAIVVAAGSAAADLEGLKSAGLPGGLPAELAAGANGHAPSQPDGSAWHSTVEPAASSSPESQPDGSAWLSSVEPAASSSPESDFERASDPVDAPPAAHASEQADVIPEPVGAGTETPASGQVDVPAGAPRPTLAGNALVASGGDGASSGEAPTPVRRRRARATRVRA